LFPYFGHGRENVILVSSTALYLISEQLNT
jgi:hypothetical protein